MFDNDFQRQWRARDIKIMIDNPEKGAANTQMSTGGYAVRDFILNIVTFQFK